MNDAHLGRGVDRTGMSITCRHSQFHGLHNTLVSCPPHLFSFSPFADEDEGIRSTGYRDNRDRGVGGRGGGERDLADRELDRSWYDDESRDTSGGGAGGAGIFLGDEARFAELEQKLAQTQSKRLSQRARKRNEDHDRWEEDRLLTSGVARRTQVDTDFDDEEINRVHLLVHDLRPPFLSGQQVFTQQQEMVRSFHSRPRFVASVRVHGIVIQGSSLTTRGVIVTTLGCAGLSWPLLWNMIPKPTCTLKLC